MNIYRQTCPSCARELELPVDSMGRLAKCPACDATFRIGESPSQTVPETKRSETKRSAEPSAQWNDSPFSKPISSTTDAESWGNGNPYYPSPPLSPPVTSVGEIQIVQRPIEDLVSATWAIFAARWPPLVLSMLILFAVIAVFTVLPFIVIAVIAEAKMGIAGGLLILLLFPFGLFLSAYATVGWSRVALSVARNEPDPLSCLLPPIHLVFRLILSGVLMISLLGLVTGLFFALVFAAAMAAQNEGIIIGMTFLAVAGLTVVVMIAQWLLWPWVFVVSDGKGSAIGSIGIAFQISINNKLTSLLIVIISFVLSTIGSMLCYVGHLATTPITVLLFAVGYLILTNQAVSQPTAGRVSVPLSKQP